MNSIYTGTISHQRFNPTTNHFNYKYSMIMFDLDDVHKVFTNMMLWSYEKFNLGSFHQNDYFKNTPRLKKDLEKHLINENVHGVNKIFLLTTPRIFGFCYNPVSFYYCFRNNNLKAIVSDINNTPWNEKFAYTHKCKTQGGIHAFNFKKEFHVSPFMPMNISYEWSFTEPNDVIIINMNSKNKDGKLFNATMKLKRKALTGLNLNLLLITAPLIPIQSIAKIYWNAFKLFLKKTPFYTHPKKNNVKKNINK